MAHMYDEEFNDAIDCGFYDTHLSALPLTEWSDRVGNGLMFMSEDFVSYPRQFMYEE